MNNRCLIGLSEELIPTPALVIDGSILEKNIKTMMDYLARVGISIRPHSKTHKSPMIAHMQMEAGAVGLCCATVGEAEAMAYSGLKHMFITSQVVGNEKVRRVANLARNNEIMVAVDSMENLEELIAAAENLGVTLGVLVEIDVGMERCGVRKIEQAVQLAQWAYQAEAIAFRGVFGYEGQAVLIEDRNKRAEVGQAGNRILVDAAEIIRNAGIPVEIVSAAGTGTFNIAAEFKGITEIQAGSYLFMDGTYGKLGLPFEQSLTVLTTVISRPTSEVFILDVGMKGISVERACPTVQNTSGLEILNLSEAHAKGVIIDNACDLQLGEKIHLVPSHCCSTVNLYDEMYVVRDGMVEAVWPITARGPY